MNRLVLLGPTVFPLLLSLLGGQLVFASVVLRNQDSNHQLPSAAILAECQTSCGNLTFNYPFGTGSPYGGRDSIGIALTYTIPTRYYGVDVYNMSWVSPAKSFALDYALMNVTGCNFEVYFSDGYSNTSTRVCKLTCPTAELMDTVARQNCNGTGCCNIYLEDMTIRSFNLNFVRINNSNFDARPNQSSLWDYINITTTDAALSWYINDQPTCASAKENNTKFACVGKNTRCIDNEEALDFGYFCMCNPGYMGNPYILNGCLRDKGYNPFPQKDNCSRLCGSTSVPFPFGIEEDCSARQQFYLNCTNMTTSTLLLDNYYLVKDIDVHEGLIKFTEFDKEEETATYMSYDGPSFFIKSGESISMKWVVANLTCPEAQANKSGYACVSTNSKCVAVNSSDGYVGYKCKCLDGFWGNPYMRINGCQDIDECSQSNRSCRGICQNTVGGFNCTPCPQKTVYDPIEMQCSSEKLQNVLVGTIIGLSSGCSVLVVSVCGIYLTRRWKRNIQKRLRWKYFRKNQGLLLEQLILSDESASDKTRIFSLEELEKATNNFDCTRVLGRGGHDKSSQYCEAIWMLS
ncbi:hypothetical protein QOZ80_4AG0321490 [Eleusine coracana subsp. coracana]|nr:hypothetical protein QOZ80_4AG0321490 [Eleusine coracana subsp. coracana]